MMMTTRKKSLFAVLAVGLIAVLGGVAAAHDGFGVGDGTGPIGVEPQDGTGFQHRSPPTTVTVVVDETATTATPAGDAAQVREQQQTQLREQDQTQLREQDQAQLREQDQAQLREQQQTQLREQDQTQLREQDQTCEQDQLQIRERDQLRVHDPAEDAVQDRDRIRACQ